MTLWMVPAATVEHQRVFAVVSLDFLYFSHIHGVISVHVGTDYVTVQEQMEEPSNTGTPFSDSEKL